VIKSTEPRALILKKTKMFSVNYKYENTGSGLRTQGPGLRVRAQGSARLRAHGHSRFLWGTLAQINE